MFNSLWVQKVMHLHNKKSKSLSALLHVSYNETKFKIHDLFSSSTIAWHNFNAYLD